MKKTVLLVALALALAASGDVVLTTPVNQPTVLGGAGTVAYDRLEILAFTVDPQAGSITVRVQLVASSDPNRPALAGTYTIVTGTGNPHARMVIPTIGFDQSLGLSAGQVSAGQSDIADFVTKLSNAAVAFGLVDGTVQ